MLNVRAVRDVDRVFHGDFDAFILGIARGDGNCIRLRFDVDGDPFQVGFLHLRGFYGMNFDFITIPALHVDGPIHVLQLEGTAGLQGIGLIDLFGDGVAGNGKNRG